MTNNTTAFHILFCYPLTMQAKFVIRCQHRNRSKTWSTQASNNQLTTLKVGIPCGLVRLHLVMLGVYKEPSAVRTYMYTHLSLGPRLPLSGCRLG